MKTKYAFFQDWCLTDPKLQSVINKQGTIQKRWHFNTRRFGFLKCYGDFFYTRSKKKVENSRKNLEIKKKE